MKKISEISRLLIELALIDFRPDAASSPALVPWHKALQLLLEVDVEGAATIAMDAFNNGVSLEEREAVIGLISKVAVESESHGPRFEALLMIAAEGGLSDCAYNVGNLITDRATTPADHILAHRYYTKAAQCSTDPVTKASALANSCAVVRDGLLTGKPDWKRAVEIYEEAAALNLAVGMFNAANVSCWLKDKGEPAYAARAVHWLNTLIARVDAGGDFVDIGGVSEVRQVYRQAKKRLAELHAMDQVEKVDVQLILSEAKASSEDPDYAAWLRTRAYEHLLRGTVVEAKPAAWQNWLSTLELMGWELDGEPVDLDLGPDTGDSRLLKFKRESGYPLVLAVVDCEEVESNGGVYRLHSLVNELQEHHDGPCFAIGSKALFIGLKTPEGDRSYTVWISTHDDGGPCLSPIWPGATADDVAAQKEESEFSNSVNFFTERSTDNGNTIAILVNALGTGRKVDGFNFPGAIYVNVGEVFNTPVFTVKQAIDLAPALRRKDIESELKVIDEMSKDKALRKRQYCGLA